MVSGSKLGVFRVPPSRKTSPLPSAKEVSGSPPVVPATSVPSSIVTDVVGGRAGRGQQPSAGAGFHEPGEALVLRADLRWIESAVRCAAQRQCVASAEVAAGTDRIARRAEAIFGSTSAVATNYAAVQKVIANLAEPTRAPIRNSHGRHGGKA